VIVVLRVGYESVTLERNQVTLRTRTKALRVVLVTSWLRWNVTRLRRAGARNVIPRMVSGGQKAA